MRQDIPAQFAAEERAERERVVEALAHWPRLSGLLHYMGDKLSAGEVDHLNEYNIASEVLGRSKTVFNAAEDAIARVEAHRLRKRLTAFYQSEGRDDPIQVSLPAGSYVPVFLHKPAGVPSSPPPESDSPGTGRHLFRSWNYWVPAGSLVLATLGVYPYFRRESSSEGRRLHPPWPWSESAQLSVADRAYQHPHCRRAAIHLPPQTGYFEGAGKGASFLNPRSSSIS